MHLCASAGSAVTPFLNPSATVVAQEIDGVGHSEVGPADLVDMPYLDACLKEAMRLYPPGVFTIRQPLTEDFEIKGWTIPKGTWIHVRSPGPPAWSDEPPCCTEQ